MRSIIQRLINRYWPCKTRPAEFFEDHIGDLEAGGMIQFQSERIRVETVTFLGLEWPVENIVENPELEDARSEAMMRVAAVESKLYREMGGRLN